MNLRNISGSPVEKACPKTCSSLAHLSSVTDLQAFPKRTGEPPPIAEPCGAELCPFRDIPLCPPKICTLHFLRIRPTGKLCTTGMRALRHSTFAYSATLSHTSAHPHVCPT